MMTKKKKNRIINIVLYVVLSLLAVIFLFPIFSMIAKSLMSQSETQSLPPLLWSKNANFSNYIKVFTIEGSYNGIPYMVLYLKNTIVLLILTSIGVVFSSAMVAYGFTKIRFPGRDAVFMVVLATMMIPGAVTMVPLYIMFDRLNWLNTLTPLWFPMWFGGGAVNIFLVKQFMRAIPTELNESAYIDGAGNFRQFFYIILPNCIPIMTVVLVGTIIGVWNDLMTPLIYLDTKENWTLAVGVTNLGLGSSGNMEGVPFVMAACTLMAIVPVTLFVFAQKYFIDNISFTGIKG